MGNSNNEKSDKWEKSALRDEMSSDDVNCFSCVNCSRDQRCLNFNQDLTSAMRGITILI